AQDFTKIDHSGSISFLVSPGQTGTSDNDFSGYLTNLHDKTFYIRVHLWWEGGYMQCVPDCPTCTNNNCNNYQCDDSTIVFTGLCHGGVITTDNGKKTMEC